MRYSDKELNDWGDLFVMYKLKARMTFLQFMSVSIHGRKMLLRHALNNHHTNHTPKITQGAYK